MSLYEYSLFNIFNQLITNKINYDEIKDLPEDILNDLNKYLMYIDDPYEEFIQEGFFISIELKHFVFAKYFIEKLNEINRIVNVNNVINYSLKYAKDTETVDFLIRNGANNWNLGLLLNVMKNDINMIKYFIVLGADDFNGAMITAVSENNKELIDYFIKLGAKNFNDALLKATENNNMELINFFIKQGATDFDDGLYVAARYGFDELIIFYINLGADDYISSLGIAIDNDHFTNLLIPPYRDAIVNVRLVGDSLLYFLRNTDFKSKSGIDINHLIPYALHGYATKQTLNFLMKLYIHNNASNYNKNKNSYYTAFGKMPSLNKKVGNKIILTIPNDDNTTTFDNIKKYSPGFVPQYIDKIYFPDMIDLNTYALSQSPKDIQKFLMNDETRKQLWIELMIVKSIVSFYDS